MIGIDGEDMFACMGKSADNTIEPRSERRNLQEVEGGQCRDYSNIGASRAPIEINGTNPLMLKSELAFTRLVYQIPFTLAAQIVRIGLQRLGERLIYTVCFKSGGTLNFYNVDTFPTDEDIGRISIEASEWSIAEYKGIV